MKLKLEGVICTRYEVEELAKEHNDITEIDFSDVKVYSASAMDSLIGLFPGAAMTGLNGWNAEQYEWVLAAREEIKQKRERGEL